MQTTSVTLLIRNRNIQPTGKWRNNQICDREGTLTVQQPERSERKSTEGHVLYNLLLVWGGRTDFLVLLFFVLLFLLPIYLSPVCTQRHEWLHLLLPPRSCSCSPNSPFGRRPHQHRSSKGRERSDLTTWSPSTHVLSTSMQSWLHTLLASHAFVAGKQSH